MENEYFYNISISEKAKNRGLKHITFLFSGAYYLVSTEMRYKACFNGYNGINRSHNRRRYISEEIKREYS